MSKQQLKTRKRKLVTKLTKSSNQDSNYQTHHSRSPESKVEQDEKHNQQLLFQQEQQQSFKQHLKSPQMRILEATNILKGNALPSKFKFRQKQVLQIQQKIKQLLNVNFASAVRKKTSQNTIVSPTKSKSQTTKNKLQNQLAKTKIIMITGSPGAGKTMSVNFVLHKFQKEGYKIIDLNSNVVKKKRDVQSILYSQLIEQSQQVKKQKSKLSDKQNNKQKRQKKDMNQNMNTFKLISQLEKSKTKCILYIQQVELFFNSYKESLSEDFFDIFTNKNIRIVLLGISNTIDALQKYGEKMNIRVSEVSNIVFNPYTKQQLSEIIKDKLDQVEKYTGIAMKMQQKMFRFISNKINEIKKGDMRIVFQFLKHLSNIIFVEKSQQIQLQSKLSRGNSSFQVQITIQVVNKCFQSITGPNSVHAKSKLIMVLPLNQQIILLSMYRYFNQTQEIFITDELLKKKIRQSFQTLGLEPKRQLKSEFSDLIDYGLITKNTSGSKNSRNQNGAQIIQRFILKISMSEIKGCFEDHPILSRLLF